MSESGTGTEPRPQSRLRASRLFNLGRNASDANRGEEVLAKGIRHTAESIDALLVEAKSGLAAQLESFVANTMEYVKREQDLLIDGVGVPDIETEIDGRHALIVVRGYHYREDIAA